MIRELSDYGLKESYKFKQIHVQTTGGLADIHDKILNLISPAIVELEALQLINGFHFIRHRDIDLRLSTDDWSANEEQIKQVLRKHNLPDNLERCPWPPRPEDYGGDIGVILDYNNLEFNSRLIAALVDLREDTSDTATQKRQEELVWNQWVHYLYIQYGGTNVDQIRKEAVDAVNWLRCLVRKGLQKDCANTLLDEMCNTIDRFRRELNDCA